MLHDAERANRSIIHIFWYFTLIRGPAIRSLELIPDFFMADENTLLPIACACSETSAFGAFDSAAFFLLSLRANISSIGCALARCTQLPA
jgi:hypothetical protein